jgi:hypothetical protein
MNALLNQGEGNEGQFIRILQRAVAPADVQAKDTGKLRWRFSSQNVVRPSLSPIAQVANDVKVTTKMEFRTAAVCLFR